MTARTQFLACAVLAGALLSLSVQAAPCTSVEQVLAGFQECSGTYSSATVAFRQSGSTSPAYATSSSFSGTGSVEVTELSFPNTFFPYTSVLTFGTEGSSAGVSGSYFNELESTQVSTDLATGALKLSGSTSPALPINSGSVLDVWYSVTGLRDQITVIFNKSLGGSVNIGLSMDVTGTLGPDSSSGGVQAQMQALSFGGSQLGYDGAQYRTAGSVDDTLSMSFSLPGATDLGDSWAASFDFNASLLANMNPGGFADFGNSAYLSLLLPVGATFTSGSGVFLTAPVPEPEHWVMLLAGLGITGWAARRHQQPSSSHQLAA